MSIKLSVAKISNVIVHRWAISAASISQAESFTAKVETKARVLGKFLDFSQEGIKETTAAARSIRDKGKGLVAMVGRRKANFWFGTVSV
jgi:DNA primase